METDQNPSVVCALFTTPKALKLFEEKFATNPYGMNARFLVFVDIGIPLGEQYDDAVNFLKHFSNPMLKRFYEIDFPFKSTIMKQCEKRGLTPFDYSNMWEHDIRNPLIFTGLTPLFVDTKYKDAYNELEKSNLKRLVSWKTEDYKADKSAICKNQEDVGEILKRWIDEA